MIVSDSFHFDFFNNISFHFCINLHEKSNYYCKQVQHDGSMTPYCTYCLVEARHPEFISGSLVVLNKCLAKGS